METRILPRVRGDLARLIGTGRDPKRRIRLGETTLMRRSHPLFHELTGNGYAEEVNGALSWNRRGGSSVG